MSFLQTLMSVLVVHVKMEVIVQMASMASPVNVLQDGLEISVKSVSEFSCFQYVILLNILHVSIDQDIAGHHQHLNDQGTFTPVCAQGGSMESPKKTIFSTRILQ